MLMHMLRHVLLLRASNTQLVLADRPSGKITKILKSVMSSLRMIVVTMVLTMVLTTLSVGGSIASLPFPAAS